MHSTIRSIVCLLCAGVSAPGLAQVTLVDQVRETTVSSMHAEDSELASGFGLFSSSLFVESESRYVYCPDPQPGDHPCDPPALVATARSNAVQSSSFSGSEFRLQGSTEAHLTRINHLQLDLFTATAESNIEVRFRVVEPMQMTIQGVGTISAIAGSGEASLGESDLRLERQGEEVLREHLFCFDLDSSPSCPGTVLAIDRQAILEPAMYTLRVRARATVKDFWSTVGTYDATAGYDLTIVFDQEHVAISQVPWSAIKQLYQ